MAPRTLAQRLLARCSRSCGQCVWASPVVAASWCALVDATLLLFGRSLAPCVLGAIGVLAALEACLGAARNSRKTLLYYAFYSVANAVVSVVLGIVTIAGVDSECLAADNEQACQLLQSVTGALLVCVPGMRSHALALARRPARSLPSRTRARA